MSLPWKRNTHLTTDEVKRLYAVEQSPNCYAIQQYCTSDADCSKCKGSFHCRHHVCTSDAVDPNQPTVECNAKHGGVKYVDIQGNANCVCTRPLFYVGEACNSKNPNLNGDISDDFDGRFHSESEQFLICPEGKVPLKLANSIGCVPRGLKQRMMQIN